MSLVPGVVAQDVVEGSGDQVFCWLGHPGLGRRQGLWAAFVFSPRGSLSGGRDPTGRTGTSSLLAGRGTSSSMMILIRISLEFLSEDVKALKN